MPTVLLSAKRLRQLLSNRPDGGKTLYFDRAIPGLVLEHRPSGRATWYFRYRSQTKRTRMKRIGCADRWTLDRVQAAALRSRELVNQGIDPCCEGSQLREPCLLSDYVVNVYLPRLRISKRGWESDQSIFKQHVEPAFGHRRIDLLSQEEITQWRDNRRRAGYAVSTCNQMLVFLGSVLNSCPDVDVSPVAEIKPLRGERRHDRTLNKAERQALNATLDSYIGSLVIPDVIRMLLLTGARKREILDARFDQVDSSRGILTVPRSKSGSARRIYLGKTAVALIERQKRSSKMEYVFPNPSTGRPYRSIHHRWVRIRAAAGLSDVRLHDLRHTFASVLVNSGRSLYDVQLLLGHKSPQTTTRYAHLQHETLREASEEAEGLL